MILCDLCDRVKQCMQKEIDGKEFDICADCWRPLEEKLKGKGRAKKTRQIVFLPPRAAPETEEPKAPPGLPPKILGAAERPT
jgi:ribosome-binding protein aMBF1 (putative translation factor)